MNRSGQHGFVNGKLCLTNLVAGHFIIEGSTDGEKAVDVVYLGFSKVFDTISSSLSTNDEVWAR